MPCRFNTTDLSFTSLKLPGHWILSFKTDNHDWLLLEKHCWWLLQDLKTPFSFSFPPWSSFNYVAKLGKAKQQQILPWLSQSSGIRKICHLCLIRHQRNLILLLGHFWIISGKERHWDYKGDSPGSRSSFSLNHAPPLLTYRKCSKFPYIYIKLYSPKLMN